MSDPSLPPSAMEFEEGWLPEDFRPLTFRQLMWTKLKAAPLVGVGCVATVVSLVMASYHMRLGNSQRFNVWLRWRVGSQAATVGAAVYYGGVAFNREKQEQLNRKQRVLLGDLPANTPIPKVSNSFQFPWNQDPVREEQAAAYRAAVLGAEADNQRQPIEDPENTAQYYPLPKEERMRAAEFAQRMRRAEIAQQEEDDAKAIRQEQGLGHSVSFAGDLLTRRMERALEDKAEGGQGGQERKAVRTMNKHKLQKEALERAGKDNQTPTGEDLLFDDAKRL